MKRNSFNIDNHLLFLTFSCYRRQALLNTEYIRDALLRNWQIGLASDNIEVVAYVVMPEHAHNLLKPPMNYDTSLMLRRLKESFSRWLVGHVRATNPRFLNSITATIGGKQTFRVWQKGGGYDRNLYSPDVINRAVNYIEFNPVSAGFVDAPELWRWINAFARANPANALLSVVEIGEIQAVR